MKKTWNYVKFDFKNFFLADLLYLLGIVIFVSVLTINASSLIYNGKIEATIENYDDIYITEYAGNENYANYTNEERDNIYHEIMEDLENYSVGWMSNDYFTNNYYENLELIYFNDIIINKFKMPIFKGSFPEKNGDAIVSYAVKNDFELGHYYYLDFKKVKIVGYYPQSMTIEEYGLSKGNPDNPPIYVLDNNDNYGGAVNYKLSKQEMNAFMERHPEFNDFYIFRNITYYKWLIKICNSEMQGNLILCVYAIALIIVAIFAYKIINNNKRKSNLAICYLYGQSKKSIAILQFIKQIIIMLFLVIFSYLVFESAMAKNSFMFTWEGWNFSIIFTISFLLIRSILNYLKLVKTDFSEILNFRE